MSRCADRMEAAPVPATLFVMVNFRQTRKPRNYLSRHEQGRILLLVMLLGLVVYMMGIVGKPDNWRRWFGALGIGHDGQRAVATSADGPPSDAPKQPARQEEESPASAASPASDRRPGDPAGRYFPRVDPERLKSVRDDTSGKEPQAWFHLFDVLKNTDQTTLQKHSLGKVGYSDVYKQSKQYRGELVTVRGTVRWACPAFPGPDSGIDKYYQLVLRPDDNPSSPIIVYCLYLPEGFPIGMDVSANAEITGFHFKRWLYRAKHIQRTAPLLAARTVRWQKAPPNVKSSPPGAGTVLLVIALAAVVGLMVAVYVYRRTQPGRPDEGGPPPDFDALREAVPPSEVGLPLEKPDDQA